MNNDDYHEEVGNKKSRVDMTEWLLLLAAILTLVAIGIFYLTTK